MRYGGQGLGAVVPEGAGAAQRRHDHTQDGAVLGVQHRGAGRRRAGELGQVEQQGAADHVEAVRPPVDRGGDAQYAAL